MTIDLIQHDKAARALALDASQSFIVQAPAGSGKTELLIQRFLTLLIVVKAPEEILAITFTKKSANEMRARVIKALKQAQTEPEPDSDHAKQTWKLARQVLQRDQQHNWNLIHNPNQLRIQTIDALCTYLTRQLPLLSHFGSQPDIADNPAPLYREAIQEVLSHVEENYEWSQAIAQLLLHVDNDLNKLHDLLVNLLAKRDQWIPYIHLDTHDREIKKQLETHLRLVISDTLRTVAEHFPNDITATLLPIARFAADNLALSNIDSPIRACRELTALPGITAENKTAWLGLAQLLLTKSFSWRKRLDEEMGFPPLASLKNPVEKAQHTEHRQQLTQLITRLNEHEAIRLALTELFYLPEPVYHEAQWDILKALLRVLKIVTAQLRLTFQQSGHIDFIENAQAALAALGSEESPTDLALALDYQIRHILVDEFQDTSYTQYQLLEKLTLGWETDDGRTLFVVGDPMQSIYRFRQAEVGLFIRMRKSGIGRVALTPLTLSLNFRSTREIVEWNNTHFQRIFPMFNDMATGAVNYSASVSNQFDTQPTSHSHIQIQGFVDADDDTQAKHITALIETVKQQHPDEKIAILVRSRAHLSDIIPALKKAGLPYRAIDIDPLASRQAIQDLLSLTCALLHPADRIAWLAVLRAPWCGLTLADLLMIAGGNPYASIAEELEKDSIIQRLSPDGQQRLARVLPILRSKMAERERHDLRYWVETTWLLLGGPACLTDETEIEDANAYFQLLQTFNHHHQVIQLDKLKEKIDRLYASTQHDDTRLQLMTIHTAKGLEFDTVILPHLERKLPADDKTLLLWMERPLTNEQIALLLAPLHATGQDKESLYEYIHRQQRIKSDYETDRLFYVAATRAKKRLYLFFNTTPKEKGGYRIESGSFLEKIWPALENRTHEIISANAVSDTSDKQPRENPRYTLRLPAAWTNVIVETNTSTIAYHKKQSGFQLADNAPRLIGIVSHRLLQQICQLGIAWWNEKSRDQQMDYLHRQLKQAGMLPDNRDAAVILIQQTIHNTLHDSRGQWIVKAHTQAQSELAITAVIENKIENLVIDRTFIDESGTRWIIDYKTAALSQADLNAFLDKEQEKYLQQMQKYYQAMQLMEERKIRLGLYFPALPAWREWDPSTRE